MLLKKHKYNFIMKRILNIILLFLAFIWFGQAQQLSQKVGSNPTLILPSAALEVESTTKGFLLPRMTLQQRDEIVAPVAGLQVYCTNCGYGELQVYNGSTWTNSIGGVTAARTCPVPTSSGGILVFQCHNLGADQSADPLVPSWKLNGAYFQWGKKPVDTNGDGYRTKPSSGAEGFGAGPTGPGAGQVTVGGLAGWSTAPAADGAWNVSEGSPVKTANDPCPSGFRVPTRNEWGSIIITNNWSNVAGSSWIDSPTNYSSGKIVNNSLLYLPASGDRKNIDGMLLNHGSYGGYWSSTVFNSTNVYYLSFDNSSQNVGGAISRLYAFSVRCVAQ